MINIVEIESELNLLMLTNVDQHKDSELAKIKKRLLFLNVCRNYLKLNPSPEFIEKECNRLSNLIDSIHKKFELWQQYSPELCIGKNQNEQRRFYEKENGLPNLKNQLKTLMFIKGKNHTNVKV